MKQNSYLKPKVLRDDGFDAGFAVILPDSEEGFRLAPAGQAILQLGHFQRRFSKSDSQITVKIRM